MLDAGKASAVYTEATFSREDTQHTLFWKLFDLLGAHGFRFMGLYELDAFQTGPSPSSYCNALYVQGHGADRETC